MHKFREAIERRDLEGVVALLSEDVAFRSPIVHQPYEGRAQVAVLLGAVAEVLEDFRYTRAIGEVMSERNASTAPDSSNTRYAGLASAISCSFHRAAVSGEARTLAGGSSRSVVSRFNHDAEPDRLR